MLGQGLRLICLQFVKISLRLLQESLLRVVLSMESLLKLQDLSLREGRFLVTISHQFCLLNYDLLLKRLVAAKIVRILRVLEVVV